MTGNKKIVVGIKERSTLGDYWYPLDEVIELKQDEIHEILKILQFQYYQGNPEVGFSLKGKSELKNLLNKFTHLYKKVLTEERK
jgi:thermostable 8-oxoguanine DNA glycosylase